MALIKCRECDNQISDTAPACPKCGATRLASLGQVRVTVVGGKGAGWGLDKLHVYLDGTFMGTIQEGDRLPFHMDQGKHTVKVRRAMTLLQSAQVSFKAVRGDDLEFVASRGYFSSLKLQRR